MTCSLNPKLHLGRPTQKKSNATDTNGAEARRRRRAAPPSTRSSSAESDSEDAEERDRRKAQIRNHPGKRNYGVVHNHQLRRTRPNTELRGTTNLRHHAIALGAIPTNDGLGSRATANV